MTTPAVAFTAPEIKVNGAVLVDLYRDRLASIRVHVELGLVGRTTLVFYDMGYELADDNGFALGSEVEVQIDTKPVFKGNVTGTALEHEHGTLPRLVVTVDDTAYRLGLTQRMESYVNKSYADIIRQLVQAVGMSANVEGGTTVNDHIVQRTSDLAFVDMIARRMNRVWWVEGTKLNVAAPAPSGAPVVLDSEDSLSEFSVRASGLRPLDVDVRGWDLKQKQNVVGQGKGSEAPATASSKFVTDYVAAKPGNKLGKKGSVLTTVANPLSQDEATTLAAAQVAAWGSSSVIARGTVSPGTAALKLNGQVKVTNVGPMTGTYTVTSIEHVYDRKGLVTHFTCGSLRPTGLVDTLGAGTAADEGLTVRSLTTGIVTNNKDPNNMGRVKVKLAGTDDSIESDWARVMTLGGGANRGVVFHPEINDEVVVAFERGDTRRPVVLGGLVNGSDALASSGKILNASSGKVDYRRVTSRAGHIVELGDGDQPTDQHILLALADGNNKMRIGANETTIDVEQGKPFTLKVGNAKIAIDAQGNISIEGLKITLKATSDIELSATTKLAAKGVQLDLAASGNAKLSGAVTAVEAQGPATLKGAVVMIN